MNFTSIDVQQLAILLEDENSEIQFIDVREPEEANTTFLSGFKLLPLSQSQQWMNQITNDFNCELETIVLCHHGMRSAQMCQWLVSQGFTHVKNVSGGIDAYSVSIDNTISRY